MKCAQCGRCCVDTEMQLTINDVQRLESLGYARADFVEEHPSGFLHLQNRAGACVFFNAATRRCLIYDSRPAGCRLYPLVYLLSPPQVVVDSTPCPHAHVITPAERKAAQPQLRHLAMTLLAEARHRRSRRRHHPPTQHPIIP